MVDVATRPAIAKTSVFDRAQALARFKSGDVVFHALAFASAISVLLILAGVLISLIWASIPAISTFGLSFFTRDVYSTLDGHEAYSALAPIYYTIVTSVIAIAIAVPIGIGIAVFLDQLCPPRLRQPLGIAIELLAGIPSIIYGIWGFLVLKPIMQNQIEPFIISLFSPIPGLNILFGSPVAPGTNTALGSDALIAGLVLSIMILPFISSISRDVFATVPGVLKESAYGLGCTTREVVGSVIIPYSRVGIVGGVMLALGRALGETMAVTFIIGGGHQISPTLLGTGDTISSAIAANYGDAKGLYLSSLSELALVLFGMTFCVLAVARYMLSRIARKGATR